MCMSGPRADTLWSWSSWPQRVGSYHCAQGADGKSRKEPLRKNKSALTLMLSNLCGKETNI